MPKDGKGRGGRTGPVEWYIVKEKSEGSIYIPIYIYIIIYILLYNILYTFI